MNNVFISNLDEEIRVYAISKNSNVVYAKSYDEIVKAIPLYNLSDWTLLQGLRIGNSKVCYDFTITRIS